MATRSDRSWRHFRRKFRAFPFPRLLVASLRRKRGAQCCSSDFEARSEGGIASRRSGVPARSIRRCQRRRVAAKRNGTFFWGTFRLHLGCTIEPPEPVLHVHMEMGTYSTDSLGFLRVMQSNQNPRAKGNDYSSSTFAPSSPPFLGWTHARPRSKKTIDCRENEFQIVLGLVHSCLLEHGTFYLQHTTEGP